MTVTDTTYLMVPVKNTDTK